MRARRLILLDIAAIASLALVQMAQAQRQPESLSWFDWIASKFEEMQPATPAAPLKSDVDNAVSRPVSSLVLVDNCVSASIDAALLIGDAVSREITTYVGPPTYEVVSTPLTAMVLHDGVESLPLDGALILSDVVAREVTVNNDLTPSTDLVASSLQPPLAARDGQLALVNYTVFNAGHLEAPPPWRDRIYLSTDATYSPTTDRLLGDFPQATPLPSLGRYTRSVAVEIPRDVSGPHYFIVFTDATGQIPEPDGGDANNIRVASVATQITRVTLPDLDPIEVTLDPATPEDRRYVGQPLTLAYRVLNAGAGTATGIWTDQIYLSTDDVFDPAPAGGDTLAFDTTQPRTLSPGSSYDQSATITLPATAGPLWLFVVADGGGQLAEADEDNNRVAVPLIVRAPDYAATISTPLETGPAGTTVPFAGVASFLEGGAPAADRDVDVRVLLRGTRRVIRVCTDAAGRFSGAFQPLSSEAGVYQLAADHPAVRSDTPQDTFTLYGLSLSPATAALDLIPEQITTGTAQLRNLGETPLTGLQYAVEGVADGLTVEVELPTELAAFGTTSLTYRLRAASGPATVLQPRVVVTSAEGARAALNLTAVVRPLVARLRAEPAELRASMLRGQTTYVQFDLVNVGGAPSGELEVRLPRIEGRPVDWIQRISILPQRLLPGERITIDLQLNPPGDLALGVYSGEIIVVGGSVFEEVQYTFTAASDRRGDLRVEATDEYSYFAAGLPRLAGAAITVRDAQSGAVVGEAVTDTSGVVRFIDLPEAYFEITATAPQHGAFSTLLLVEGDQERRVEAFLPRQTVRYEWVVVPTSVPDRYSIRIEAIFETAVPVPVLTVEPAVIDLSLSRCEPDTIYLTITNHGLITARNVRFQVGNHPRWRLTPVTIQVGDLAAQQSVVVPVQIDDNCDPAGRCRALSFSVLYDVECGILRTYTVSVPVIMPFETCEATPGSFVFIGSGGGGGAGGGGGSGGGGGGSSGIWIPPPPSSTPPGPTIIPPVPIEPSIPVFCDPCDRACAVAIADCALSAVEGYGCAIGFTTPCDGATALELLENPACLWEAGGCALQASGAFTSSSDRTNSTLELVQCLCGMLRECGFQQEWCEEAGGTPPSCSCDAAELIERVAGGDDCFRSQLTEPLGNFLRERLVRGVLQLAPYAEIFGDVTWLDTRVGEETLAASWAASFSAAASSSGDLGVRVSPSERSVLLAAPRMSQISSEQFQRFVDRWNRTHDYWDVGIFEISQVPSGQSTDFITRSRLQQRWDASRSAAAADAAEGYDGVFESALFARQLLVQDQEVQPEGICARVRVAIDQEAVVSRSAFVATLTVDNDGKQPLEEFAVSLEVRDAEGRDATAFFSLGVPEVTGIIDVRGGGAIAPSAGATARWTIIPLDEAAPQSATAYFVRGTMTYRSGGQSLTIPLFPAPITVLPNPRLSFKYFLEQRVYADDPFTPEFERSVPFSLGLLVRNRGAGAARNVQITSGQPEIIDSDRGLAILFQIIGAQVGALPVTPSLSVNLGDLDPGQTRVARWLLTASLEGRFVAYGATIQHIDGLGDPRLSIVDPPEIFAMSHVMRIDRDAAGASHDDGLPDFLTNEVPDIEERPDRVHSSDGMVLPVSQADNVVASGGSPSPSGEPLVVTAEATTPGWFYLRIEDPTGGRYTLAHVRRDDGREIRLIDNAWRTSRIVRIEGEAPRPERLLHIVDHAMSAGSVRHEIVFGAPPGDTDCDGFVTLNDIESFVAALVGQATYESRYPDCAWLAADTNGDGSVDFDDIGAFVECIVRGACR